jgi:hypothetical protein
VDERDIGIRPEHEALLALAEKMDAERAIARKAAEPLFAELRAAELARDLSLVGKVYKRLAAHFEDAGCQGDAQTYALNAKECRARLSRRTWVENRKGERR